MTKCKFCTIILLDPKEIEEKLCFDCNGIEKQIKNRCFICKKKFENTLHAWKNKGNCCVKCDSKADIAVEKLKEQQREIARIERYHKWLDRTDTFDTKANYNLFCNLDAQWYTSLSNKSVDAPVQFRKRNLIN